MLSPEIWNFKSASENSHIHGKEGNEILAYCEDVINNHHLNHHVSVVISDCEAFPEDLSNILKSDSEYYSVDLPLASLIDQEFINAFILSGGEVSALTVGTRLDADACTAALLPSGHLVLSVRGDHYRTLGLEGVPSISSDRYGVAIDLKRECFKPGKKNYERTSRSLSKFKPGNFEFIIAWDPHDENICPSTIAKYFSEKGYIVRQCQPCFDYRLDSGVLIPMLQATPQTELLEWLGAFSLGVFRKYRLDPSPEAQEYLSTYEIPTSSTKSKKTVLFQCSGLFTRKKMLNIFEKLRLYASDRMEDKSWVSLTIQGFMDSPVSWSWKPHGRYRNGDNQFTIFMEKDRLLCIKVVPSNGKSK